MFSNVISGISVENIFEIEYSCVLVNFNISRFVELCIFTSTGQILSKFSKIDHYNTPSTIAFLSFLDHISMYR